MNREQLIVSVFCFLETDIRVQKSMTREYRHLWIKIYTVNDLHYEIKFENRVKDKNSFFIKRNISFQFETKIHFLFLETYFLKIPKNLIALAFFLPRHILKNSVIPRHFPTAKANFKHWSIT